MYVNKKDLILIFCTKYCFLDLKGKKAPQRPVFEPVILRACFAYVPGCAQAIASILLGKPCTLVFTMIYGIHCYFFRFADLMFFLFSQGKRTPKKSGTPQRF